MKAFKGTLVAAVVLVVVGALVWTQRPAVFTPDVVEGTRIFQFEKHELVRVEVDRPQAERIVLVEQDGGWIIEGSGHQAGRSMVNRVKHQIHDLSARAAVVEAPENPEIFGLGKNAIAVALTMRDGRRIAFRVGDPNPTSVSYYLQPEGSDAVYTVQKAAVDYYSLTLDEFRERRFATFDSKDVVGFDAVLKLPEADYTLSMTRTGDRLWEMQSPIQMAADHDEARRLLGRISALKAVRFEAKDDALLEAQGITAPRIDMQIRFASRDPLRVRIGGDAPKLDRHDALAYVLIDDEDTVYVARSGLLEAFSRAPSEMRNRRVVKMDAEDVVSIDAVIAETADPFELSGEGAVRYAAEQWVWADGVPVSGSTPKRVARRFAELEVDDFIDGADASEAKYGLTSPRVRVTLKDAADGIRVVSLGAKGPAHKDSEGNSVDRFYASIEGESAVYLVHHGVYEVVRDLVRESERKATRDAEKAARQERIGAEASQ